MTKLMALNGADVRRLLPMDRCIELMADALARLAAARPEPAGAGYRLPGGRGLVATMPGALSGADGAGHFGAKLISVFPGNRERGLESHQA